MPTPRGIWLALAVCATVVTAVVAAASRWQTGSQKRLSAIWEDRIQSLDEASAIDLVRSLRQHDVTAVPSLVAALSDQRPAVVRAAQESVGNLVVDWKRLPAKESVPRLTALAGQLADHQPRFPPAPRQFTRQLAQLILTWPLSDADFPADDLVAHCQRILALPAVDTSIPEQSVPSESAPHVARRPQQSAPLPQPSDPQRQEPAPILEAPALSPPQDGDPRPSANDPAADATEPRPTEPRQFIGPRVPMIPAPDEP